jgi:hypothetical protein
MLLEIKDYHVDEESPSVIDSYFINTDKIVYLLKSSTRDGYYHLSMTDKISFFVDRQTFNKINDVFNGK